MKLSIFVRTSVTLLTGISLVFHPGRTMAATPKTAQYAVTPSKNVLAIQDVVLGPGGTLTGQLVDGQGKSLANQIVSATQSKGKVHQAVTDSSGRFLINQLSSGVYTIRSDKSGRVCRLWADGTAPPVATSELLIVHGDMITRGQRPIGELFTSTPVLLGIVIATAVAVPLVVFDDESGS